MTAKGNGFQSDKSRQLKSEQLRDEGVEDWLSCDSRQSSSNALNVGVEDYAIRLLICQTSNATNDKICYHMSKDSYLAVQECFELPSRTLTSANDLWSVQACQFLPIVGKDGKEAISLGTGFSLP